jgi:hypothetical protein
MISSGIRMILGRAEFGRMPRERIACARICGYCAAGAAVSGGAAKRIATQAMRAIEQAGKRVVK